MTGMCRMALFVMLEANSVFVQIQWRSSL